MSSPEVQCLVSLLTLVSQTARSYTCTVCTCTLSEEKTFVPLGQMARRLSIEATEVYFSKYKATEVYFTEMNPTEV